MTHEQARKLQLYIYDIYPSLPVIIRAIGDKKRHEYACMVEPLSSRQYSYFLWSESDFKKYMLSNKRQIYGLLRSAKSEGDNIAIIKRFYREIEEEERQEVRAQIERIYENMRFSLMGERQEEEVPRQEEERQEVPRA